MSPAEPTPLERFEAAASGQRSDRYVLRLYVAGSSPTSAQAISRLRSICAQHLPGQVDIEIVDVNRTPERAAQDDIFAIPTLLKELPAPLRRIIGDLSDEGRVLLALGIEPKD